MSLNGKCRLQMVGIKGGWVNANMCVGEINILVREIEFVIFAGMRSVWARQKKKKTRKELMI